MSFGFVIWVSLWVTLELVLRLVGYGDYIIYEPDDELLWLPRPNQQGKTVAGHKEITIGAEGFRYKVNLEKSIPGRKRIVAFGDSVTMGWGVDDDSHFSAVLERRLAEIPSMGSYQVISAGVNAYPMSLCTRRFAQMLAQGYQIDIAIISFSFNTGFEPLGRLEGENREKMLRRVRMKSIVRRFAVYNLLIEDWLRDIVYYRVRERLVIGSWETTQGTAENVMFDYRSDLGNLKNLAEENDIRLIFLLLGSNGQKMELNEYQIEFLQFARRNSIQVVDMVNQWESIDHNILYMDHVHPNENGHKLIAESLLDSILK